MEIRGLVTLLQQSDQFKRFRAALHSGGAEHLLGGVSGSQKRALVAALRGTWSDDGPVLVVTYSQQSAEQWAADLRHLLGESAVGLFVPLETLPHEEVSDSPELTGLRVDAALRLLGVGHGPSVVVADAGALSERWIPPEVLRAHTRALEVGTSCPLEEVAAGLIVAGYERRGKVEAPGQLSVRGDILDVFPPTESQPVRIEWFDLVVESIRRFDVASQRSGQTLEWVLVPPARELILTSQARERALRLLEAAATQQAGRLRAGGRHKEAEALSERTARHLEQLREHGYFPGVAQYKLLLYPTLSLLPAYMASAGLVVLDEPLRVKERLGAAESEFAEGFKALLEQGRLLPTTAECFGWWPDILRELRRFTLLYLSLLPRRSQDMAVDHNHSLDLRPAEGFQGNLEALVEELQRRQKQHYRVLLALSNPARAQRAREALVAERVPAILTDRLDGELKPGNVVIVPAALESGFEMPELKLLVLTDAEVYGRQRRVRRTRPAGSPEGVRIGDYLELHHGDYVVHVNHGIGQYQGIQTMEVGGVRRDYLVVKYAGEDRLYVPTDQVELLQKYIGGGDAPPRLNRLGGTEWARAKRRVKESVQEMAESLLRLYAERQSYAGHVYSPDSAWQREFEDAFQYEETPDQIRATEEVKADMEAARPMDRLLCGDVGYGKTEVAMRAAFKAVADGKQVAVLVPTTILAQQHQRTFSDRFSGYPVRVAMLSRFQSAGEQSEILKGLRLGTVDVVIGTHRLLSRDVQFKDLGLVIIDEEQRFGVVQKERLKELRRTVDVLTLTATPIPRTLHMALSGVRDMSVIETPPEGRYPVRTYVVEYQDEMVRDAIQRELGRGGQVYFVHNRVQTIDKMAAHVQQLVPEARVAVAHGQMEESRLEQVMLDFLNGAYDVLICTSIIETGMDIANVNTLIVHDADRMGLAQLYQLRGRVGRTNRVAYAYFTYRKEKVLTEDAERRLQAIREFTELGSGFKIALRDLEIRGAGNILGPEQHGFIASVGFELYLKLLEESVRELKGQTVQRPPDPAIELPVDAYIPDGYVPDAGQKVEFYKRIAAASSQEELEATESDMRDRFGDLPEPVRNLMAVARLKLMARDIGVSGIALEREAVVIRAWQGMTFPGDALVRAAVASGGRVSYRPGRMDQVWVRTRGAQGAQLLQLVEQVLGPLREAWHGNGAAAAGGTGNGAIGAPQPVSGRTATTSV